MTTPNSIINCLIDRSTDFRYFWDSLSPARKQHMKYCISKELDTIVLDRDIKPVELNDMEEVNK